MSFLFWVLICVGHYQGNTGTGDDNAYLLAISRLLREVELFWPNGKALYAGKQDW